MVALVVDVGLGPGGLAGVPVGVLQELPGYVVICDVKAVGGVDRERDIARSPPVVYIPP